jgi:phosphatidylglycerol:prolipoprotein diacylglycerol transferase
VIPSFGSIFGEDLPAYFTMLTCAFVVCTWFAVRWGKQSRLDHEVLIDLALVSVITGVAGARIAHVLFDGFLMDYVHLCTDYTQVDWHITREQCAAEWVQGAWDEAEGVCHPTEQDCFAALRFWQGGLTWYGGMIGAVGYAMHFFRKEGFPRLKALDLAGLVLPVGLFFGRLGCWFGGCCFGLVTEHPLGVSFPAWSPASEQQWRDHLLDHPSQASLPVYPTQLMEALGSLLIAFVAIGLVHPRKRFDGQVFCVSMALYALLRFGLEFLRADDRGIYGGLATSQWISLGLLAFVALVWARAKAYADGQRAAIANAAT